MMLKRMTVIAVLLACVAVLIPTNQCEAGGILEFLFGSKPKMVQWFAPACDGDIHARNPFTLQEETFDLQGDGNRVTLDSGIPVERGLVLIGSVCPKTGPNATIRGIARLDGSEVALEVVEGPKPSDDQEQWLSYMVARARYNRGSSKFRGFMTVKAPYLFGLDTGILMMGAHSVEVFLWTGKGQGAGVVLPFRVVRPVDESTGQSVASEFEAPPQQTYAMPVTPGGTNWPAMPQTYQSPQVMAPAWPATPTVTQYNGAGAGMSPSQMPCWAELQQIAEFTGYRDVFDHPTTPCYFNPASSNVGSQPFVFFVVRNGRIDRFRDYCLIVNGQAWNGDRPDGSGVIVVDNFHGGERVAPVVDGKRQREFVVRPGQGIWSPVVVP